MSLGRFVAKKNLATLIQAFRKFLDSNPDCQTHLVMVGSGEEESKLRSLCQELRLPIYEKTSATIGNRQSAIGNELPGVHFYGFRQIDENPVFYALADAFILPSLYEEWGLVVNEAMASGLPVVVSETAGCVEDLLETGRQTGLDDQKNADGRDVAGRRVPGEMALSSTLVQRMNSPRFCGCWSRNRLCDRSWVPPAGRSWRNFPAGNLRRTPCARSTLPWEQTANTDRFQSKSPTI